MQAAYLLSASICICVFLAFREETYISSTNLPGLVLLLILYGWSSIPMMYPAVKLFSIPSSAFVALACGNMFIGVVTTVATFVLTIFDDEVFIYFSFINKNDLKFCIRKWIQFIYKNNHWLNEHQMFWKNVTFINEHFFNGSRHL